MLSSIKLNKNNSVFKQYKMFDNSDELTNLSKINIFVGANNSGKSRLLREIFKNYSKAFLEKKIEIKKKALSEIEYPLKIAKDEVIDILAKKGVYAENDQPPIFNKNEFESFLIDVNFDNYSELNRTLELAANNDFEEGEHGPELVVNQYAKNLHDNIIFDTYKIINDLIDKENYFATYIPILRSLRSISNSEQYYRKRTFDDYFKDIDYNVANIFTGEMLYQTIKDLLLSNYSDRKIITDFENFLSVSFFESQKISLIPIQYKDKSNKELNNDLYIKIGNEKEYPIYNLGDGIQTIIILTFPLFLNQHKKHFLFIEEPEQNLHPGLQRVLLNTFASEKFLNTQVFIASHSNHLLEMCSKNNTSIYSLKKDILDGEKGDQQTASFIVTNLNSPDTNILDMLGVNNSSVFLANCTIWVEGITDRKYIKKFLEIYFKHHKTKNYFEDLHYSFVEYAGSNIVHWDFSDESDVEKIFAKSISNRIFLIVDSDINEQGIIAKDDRHKKLKEVLGDENFYRIETKEIENSLSAGIINKVVAEYETSKKYPIKPEDLKFKNDIAELIELDSINESGVKFIKPVYWNKNLGNYIDENLTTKKRIGSYQDGNTISDKVKFCDRAINHIKSYEDLSEVAIDLCKKVVDFIERHNK